MGELAAATVSDRSALRAAGAAVTTLLAIPVAWLAVRHRAGATHPVERSTYIANALPGIVVGARPGHGVAALVPADLPDRRCCSSRRTPILFLPRAVVRSAPGWSRRPPCSTTSRTASAAVRSRPRAG